MPAMMKCEGCCVKLVQNIGTPQYSVRRTCTDNLGKLSYSFEYVFITIHIVVFQSDIMGQSLPQVIQKVTEVRFIMFVYVNIQKFLHLFN